MAIAKASKPLIIILTIAALALATSTLGAIVVSQNLSTSGTITTGGGGGGGGGGSGSPNVGVYSDSACNTNITAITWGSLTAGGSTTQTVYVKNTGTANMTLSLAVTNWAPSAASNYITITWNKEGTQLTPGQSVAATLTLSVASGITGITSYSNTITISGTG
jgi:hypothetical protein